MVPVIYVLTSDFIMTAPAPARNMTLYLALLYNINIKNTTKELLCNYPLSFIARRFGVGYVEGWMKLYS